MESLNLDSMPPGRDHFNTMVDKFRSIFKYITFRRVYRNEDPEEYFQEALVWTWKYYSVDTKSLRLRLLEIGMSWRRWFMLTIDQGAIDYYKRTHKKSYGVLHVKLFSDINIFRDDQYDPAYPDSEYDFDIDRLIITLEMEISVLQAEDKVNVIAFLKSNCVYKHACIQRFGVSYTSGLTKIKTSVSIVKHRMEVAKSPSLSRRFENICFSEAVDYITKIRGNCTIAPRAHLVYLESSKKFKLAASFTNLHAKRIKDFTIEDFFKIRTELDKSNYQTDNLKLNYTRLLKGIFKLFYSFGLIKENPFSDCEATRRRKNTKGPIQKMMANYAARAKRRDQKGDNINKKTA